MFKFSTKKNNIDKINFKNNFFTVCKIVLVSRFSLLATDNSNIFINLINYKRLKLY